MADITQQSILSPTPKEHTFQTGEVLQGRFRIVREVARGGMGIVYEAFDQRLERRIALKCAKPGFQKRLPPEVRNASEITHLTAGCSVAITGTVVPSKAMGQPFERQAERVVVMGWVYFPVSYPIQT